jgi:hypothetical protein
VSIGDYDGPKDFARMSSAKLDAKARRCGYVRLKTALYPAKLNQLTRTS